MNRFMALVPRPVLISICVIVGTLIAFVIALEMLGGGRDRALADNSRLGSEIQTANSAMRQSIADQQYIKDNLQRYEALMQSDRLVPHTRRAAVVALQSAAQQYGFGGLNYTFSAASALSAQSVANQPKSGAYAVASEAIKLTIKSPLDGSIYRFMTELPTSFPGALVLEGFELRRGEKIDGAALANVGSIVTGEATFLWRTAQAAQQPGAAK